MLIDMYVVCADVFDSRTWSVPESVCNHSQELLLPSRHRERSIEVRVLSKQTNKQTNKPFPGVITSLQLAVFCGVFCGV